MCPGRFKVNPKKDIFPINGKPLIVYSIESAFEFAKQINADVELSTDDQEIKDVCAQYGLKTEYQRPASMATDSAGKIEVIRDLLEYAERKNNLTYDCIIDLDVTSPLQTKEDLSNAFEAIKKDENCLNLFSVSPARKSPYFNMVEKKKMGSIL